MFIPDRPIQPNLMFLGKTCGLYYKPMMIINDNSRVINKLEASLTDNARVVIYKSSHVYSTSHRAIFTNFYFHVNLRMGPIF